MIRPSLKSPSIMIRDIIEWHETRDAKSHGRLNQYSFITHGNTCLRTRCEALWTSESIGPLVPSKIIPLVIVSSSRLSDDDCPLNSF